MSTVDLIALNLDGTYTREKADVGDKLIVGRKSQGTIAITRTSTFPKTAPLPFDSLAQLLKATRPLPPLGRKKRMVVAGFNDPWPVQYDETELPDRVRKEAVILKESARQNAVYAETEAAEKRRKDFSILFTLAIGASVVASAFSLMVVFKVLL